MEEKNINGKPVLPLPEYQELQRQEMLNGDNLWYAGECLGHSPTRDEAAEHYIKNGGPENFAQRFIKAGLVSGAGDGKGRGKET